MIIEFLPSVLTLTEKAKEKALSLKEEDKLLRVYVEGGGCSGFQYGFKLDNKNEDDTVVDSLVLVDSLSYSYILGSTLDYEEDIMASGFKITNPNAVGTCGCGVSFTI